MKFYLFQAHLQINGQFWKLQKHKRWGFELCWCIYKKIVELKNTIHVEINKLTTLLLEWFGAISTFIIKLHRFFHNKENQKRVENFQGSTWEKSNSASITSANLRSFFQSTIISFHIILLFQFSHKKAFSITTLS